MNLIIIDDEKLMVKSLLKGIDWKNIGFEQVYTAYGITDAKKMFERGRIEVMLCDIEMPGGNGIEMLKWVNSNYPHVISVFLTCHADFKYAQEAISLGSFNYLLKPVNYEELSEIMSKACMKVKEWEQNNLLKSFGNRWKQNEAIFVEKFWEDFIHGKLGGTKQAAQDALKLRKLDYTLEEQYGILLVETVDVGMKTSQWDSILREFTIKNIIQEELEVSGIFPNRIQMSEKRLMIILSEKLDSDYRDYYMQRTEAMIAYIKSELDIQLFSLLSLPLKFESISEAVEKMERYLENMVLYEKETLVFQELVDNTTQYQKPKLTLWGELMEKQNKTELFLGIDQYLDDLIQKRMVNSEILNLFYHDVIHLLYNYLMNKGIEAGRLLEGTSFKKNYREATGSVKIMKGWIRELVEKSFGYVDIVDEKTEIIEKLKNYIDANLDSDLSRNILAELVYLNPDYMTRFF